MHAIALLLCIVASILTVNANVEKTIFLGPAPVHLPNVQPSLESLRLDTLVPVDFSVLATKLSVAFPTETAPHGLESWYLLRALEDGRRYEVRICWPAFVSCLQYHCICFFRLLWAITLQLRAFVCLLTRVQQPTDFWLDTFPITKVFDTPELISSLAEYSEQRQASSLQKTGYATDRPEAAQSILLLRIQAAATYYSTNKTLMLHPSPVDVDIILDPFILNILPRSLGPAAIYITGIAIAAWFISGYIYRWIVTASQEFEEKDHQE